VYHLHRTELNATFLETLRSRIDAERVTITIAPEHNDKAAFEEKILASVQDAVSFVFTTTDAHDEFEEFSEKLLRDESVDSEQYKRMKA